MFLDPTLFHVFSNLQIIIAGGLYKVFMHKKDIRWLGLFLLMIGAMLSTPEISFIFDIEGGIASGLATVLLTSVLTVTAMIYTEKFYKSNMDLSIYYQNFMIYLAGITLNAAFIVCTNYELVSVQGLLSGWNKYSYHALFATAGIEVAVAFMFKYLDTISYVIVLAVSIFFSSIISAILFNMTIQYCLVLGAISGIIGIYLHFRSTK